MYLHFPIHFPMHFATEGKRRKSSNNCSDKYFSAAGANPVRVRGSRVWVPPFSNQATDSNWIGCASGKVFVWTIFELFLLFPSPSLPVSCAVVVSSCLGSACLGFGLSWQQTQQLNRRPAHKTWCVLVLSWLFLSCLVLSCLFILVSSFWSCYRFTLPSSFSLLILVIPALRPPTY